jgi:uncharacterized protein YxjI
LQILKEGGIMQSFTIKQKILAIGDTYEVRQTDSDEVLYLIKGKVLTFSPRLEMKQGIDGEVSHVLKGNFWRTEFTVIDKTETEIGVIRFPFVAFFKKFTLVTGGKTYDAKGSITAWNFTCKDETDRLIFSIGKEFAFRDKFTVDVDESIQKEVAILTAISVDQKFFQQQ